MGTKNNQIDRQHTLISQENNGNNNIIMMLIILAQVLIMLSVIYYIMFYISTPKLIDSVYGIHDKARVRLQVFQNLHNFALLVDNPITRELITKQYEAFVKGAWTYLMHLEYLNGFGFLDEEVNWNEGEHQHILSDVKKLMTEEQVTSDSDATKVKTQQENMITKLIEYVQSTRPEKFVDIITIPYPNDSRKLIVKSIHKYYNKLIQLPHIITFLTILDKAQETIK